MQVRGCPEQASVERRTGTTGPGFRLYTASDRRRCLPPLLPCTEVLPEKVPGGLGSSLGISIIGIVLAIGFYAGIAIDLRNRGLPSEIPPNQAPLVYGLSDSAVNQGMEYAFAAMILVVVIMFIAALFIRKTGKHT